MCRSNAGRVYFSSTNRLGIAYYCDCARDGQGFTVRCGLILRPHLDKLSAGGRLAGCRAYPPVPVCAVGYGRFSIWFTVLAS